MVFANVLQPLIDVEEWILEHLHAAGLGWGLAIVALTLFVRLCTVPLTVRQFRSQRELREHMPELKRMQQRLKHDKQRLQTEMQAYYRAHGINPLAPLLPTVVQIPIFISLYFLMRTDAREGEFGHSSFLFVPDLTARPEGAVLVALVLAYLTSQVSGSLIATRKMKGGQRGLMLVLPALFVGVVSRFPAGLAVYWITTSLWTLGQQTVLWRIAPDVPLSGATPDQEIAAEPVRGESSAGRAPRRRKRKRGHGRQR